MKKRYTRKQILESIAYWKKQLKLGNYKKVNESTNKPLNYPLELYGEMSLEGSYGGLEHWWLVVVDDYVMNAMPKYVKAIKTIISNFESEYAYAYIDPKTHKVVDSDGLDYKYIAEQMCIYNNDEVLIKCSHAYERKDFDLNSITQKDCDRGVVRIKWPDQEEYDYCMNDGAVTEI